MIAAESGSELAALLIALMFLCATAGFVVGYLVGRHW